MWGTALDVILKYVNGMAIEVRRNIVHDAARHGVSYIAFLLSPSFRGEIMSRHKRISFMFDCRDDIGVKYRYVTICYATIMSDGFHSRMVMSFAFEPITLHMFCCLA